MKLTRLSGMPSVITIECPSMLYVGGVISDKVEKIEGFFQCIAHRNLIVSHGMVKHRMA